jgi:hypothetical protein
LKLEKLTNARDGSVRWSFAGTKPGHNGQINVRYQFANMPKHLKGVTKTGDLQENTDHQIVFLGELSMQVILDRKTGILYPLQPQIKIEEAEAPHKLSLADVANHINNRKLAGHSDVASTAEPTPPPVAVIPTVTPAQATAVAAPASSSPFDAVEQAALLAIDTLKPGFAEALITFTQIKTDDASLEFLNLVKIFLVNLQKIDERKKSIILTIIQQGVSSERIAPIEKATLTLKALLQSLTIQP